MGKHSEWRKIAKKLRRKRLRQAKAKERDQKLLEEQERLKSSPRYQQWLKYQENIEKEAEEEEARQSAQRQEQWRKAEIEAQKQFQELQKKVALAREEKQKQIMKIKHEWEIEEKRLKELREAKEKEQEEKRQLQLKHEKELLDFLEQGGDTPEHLKTQMETNPGKQLCPFFNKVSACRFFDRCSRNHIRPGISKTILISNFFSDISLETKENEHGSDSSLEFENEEIFAHYKEFFYDVVSELETYGKIRNFRTCCNHEAHLRGNVYVEYATTRQALVSYHKLNGRWYGGKQLNVEFCNIDSWKNAICGLFHRKQCPKGNACNFLHVFKNPRNLYTRNEEDSVRNSSRRKKQLSKREHFEREDSWDVCSEVCSSERRNWRWSESPEPSNTKLIEDRHKKNGGSRQREHDEPEWDRRRSKRISKSKTRRRSRSRGDRKSSGRKRSSRSRSKSSSRASSRKRRRRKSKSPLSSG